MHDAFMYLHNGLGDKGAFSWPSEIALSIFFLLFDLDCAQVMTKLQNAISKKKIVSEVGLVCGGYCLLWLEGEISRRRKECIARLLVSPPAALGNASSPTVIPPGLSFPFCAFKRSKAVGT